MFFGKKQINFFNKTNGECIALWMALNIYFSFLLVGRYFCGHPVVLAPVNARV